RPVVHPRPPALAAGGTRAVDVRGDRFEDLVTQGGPAVNVAQGREDRDDLVAAVEVQLRVRHRRAAQPLLAFHRLSHRVVLLEDPGRPDGNPRAIRTGRA